MQFIIGGNIFHFANHINPFLLGPFLAYQPVYNGMQFFLLNACRYNRKKEYKESSLEVTVHDHKAYLTYKRIFRMPSNNCQYHTDTYICRCSLP